MDFVHTFMLIVPQKNPSVFCQNNILLLLQYVIHYALHLMVCASLIHTSKLHALGQTSNESAVSFCVCFLFISSFTQYIVCYIKDVQFVGEKRESCLHISIIRAETSGQNSIMLGRFVAKYVYQRLTLLGRKLITVMASWRLLPFPHSRPNAHNEPCFCLLSLSNCC